MTTFTQNLSEQQLALLPTKEDVAFYEEHGWYISKPGVIPDEVIDRAILGAEKFYAGEKDWQLPVSDGYSDWKPEDGDTIRNNEFVSLQKQELRDLGLQPIIGAIAAKLARTNQIRLLDDQLVYKPPQANDRNSTVGWHTDRAYWATCTSNKLLTAWIPFHDCDEARGPLVVLDRSHQWSGLQDLRFFNDPNLEDLEAKYRQLNKRVVRVPMTLKRGQISFHNCWTIHGSYANKSDKFRLAMAVHLQDKDNCYQSFWNRQGKEIHIFDESLCRKLANGEPDFSDPAVFPVLWEKQ
jgi:hypothetical protein